MLYSYVVHCWFHDQKGFTADWTSRRLYLFIGLCLTNHPSGALLAIPVLIDTVIKEGINEIGWSGIPILTYLLNLMSFGYKGRMVTTNIKFVY